MTLLVSETSRADAGRENSDLSSARVKKSKNNVLFDEGWHPTNEPKHLDTEDRLPNGGNIMIIDDEPDLLVSYKLNLAELGVDCFATTDPSVALQEFAKDVSKYDLVISDIRMKSINGFQVYKQLKGLRPNIKIILVSALDIPSEIFSIIPGFRKDDFVAKPIERNTLVQKVRAALSESE